MARAKIEKVSFRWGIPLLDAGFTVVPNFMFSTYSAIGVDRAEFLFILHLARYHYESPAGMAHPSLETLAEEMGVSKRWVRKLRASLEKRGFLRVTQRAGETSVYDFSGFGRECVVAHRRLEALRNSSSGQKRPSSGWGLDELGSGGVGDGPGSGGAAVDIKARSRKLDDRGVAAASKTVVAGEGGGVASRNSSSGQKRPSSGGGTTVPPPPELQFLPPRNSSSPEEEEEKKLHDDDDDYRAWVERTFLDEIGAVTPAVRDRLTALLDLYPDRRYWSAAFGGVVSSGVRRLDYLEACLASVGKPHWSKPK